MKILNRQKTLSVLVSVFLGLPGVFVSSLWIYAESPTRPPVAKRVDHFSTWHGEKVNDPYYWLREKTNPETIRYLEAENAYTQSMTKEIRPLADILYKEMLGHIKQTDQSAPTKQGAYYYYNRSQEGKQYPIRCRKKMAANGSFDAKASEEILLDLNELATGEKYLSLGVFGVSDDSRYLAYTTDTSGFRQFRLYVKDLQTGMLLPDSAERVTSLEWTTDNRTLYFTTEDPVTKRSNMLWRHTLGDETEPIYQEKDRLFIVFLGRSKDKKMLFLNCLSTDTYETRYLEESSQDSAYKIVLPRKKGHKYNVEHRDGLFYIRTNRDAKNFRLMTAPVADPSPAKWKEVLPQRDAVLLQQVEVFAKHLVVSEKESALTRFRIQNLESGQWTDVSFPDPVYDASLAATPEFTASAFRFAYQSLVTPPSQYDCSLATGERTLLKTDEVPAYDAGQFITEREWAIARDGVRIPLSIVRHKNTKKGAPLFLYAYGSYGFGTPASFNSNRLVFLDRGMIYVIAHIRGGNEMGEAWHFDGMLMKKKNTCFDFIDSAEWLVAQGWTQSDRLVIEGGSAGGLLMGAVTNMRPDLFKAVHAAVPFVDVMNTMMDASLPLTVGEYLEWGNPNEKPAFNYMRSYSPYDNIEAKAYPAMLVTTSLNDSQVMYWEPTKYVAKLRAAKTDNHLLLLKCIMNAGHGGASGRYDALKEKAFEYAWLMSQVGIKQ